MCESCDSKSFTFLVSEFVDFYMNVPEPIVDMYKKKFVKNVEYYLGVLKEYEEQQGKGCRESVLKRYDDELDRLSDELVHTARVIGHAEDPPVFTFESWEHIREFYFWCIRNSDAEENLPFDHTVDIDPDFREF